MNKIAIIGGSALPALEGFQVVRTQTPKTPYGAPSGPILLGDYHGHEIYFLNRHGLKRALPPHKINYQANIYALHALEVNVILSVGVVGGIRSDMKPGHFAFPDQLIDYTYNRANSFFTQAFDFTKHVDFTYPYSPTIHQLLVDTAQNLGLDFTDDATYGVAQGPRFETLAEIKRMERDGCDIVGMTSMPEAVLCRELAIEYACIAIVGANAAGRHHGVPLTSEEMKHIVTLGVQNVHGLLAHVIEALHRDEAYF